MIAGTAVRSAPRSAIRKLGLDSAAAPPEGTSERLAAGTLRMAGAAPVDCDEGRNRGCIRLRRHGGATARSCEPETWPLIHDAWDEFMRYVRDAQAPPLPRLRTVCPMNDRSATQAAIEAGRAWYVTASCTWRACNEAWPRTRRRTRAGARGQCNPKPLFHRPCRCSP